MSHENHSAPGFKHKDKQSLITHLTELRRCLLRSMLVVGVIVAALLYFANDIYLIISAPLRQLLPEGTAMIATDVASPFLAPFKLTLMVSVVLAAPFWLYQAWRFVAPGLYRHEKRIGITLLIASIVLFYTGLLFAYHVVFPLLFGFFSQVGPEGIHYTPDMARFLDTVLVLFFAFGIAFEMPVAVTLLICTGAVSTQSLAKKRPYVIVGCFVVGMLLTPPDVVSQALLAVPMWLLFECGLVLSRWFTISSTAKHENLF